MKLNHRSNSSVMQQAAFPMAAAFTFLELLVILGVLALLLSVLIPTMSKSGLSSRAFQCLNNNRQLCNAWRMYADDNRDLIVYASDDGTGTSNPSNRYAWTWMHLDFDSGNRAAWDPNVDLAQRPLWPYTGRNAAVYKCPSDQSALLVIPGSNPRPRLRSMVMNIYLGGFAGTDGGWPFTPAYQIYFKTTELTAPTPAKTFVFMDERWDAITWGGFMTDMIGYTNNPNVYEFYDLPGMYHDLGASFSFADGHTELHRWTDPRTTPPINPQQIVTFPIESPRNLDIAWLQDHATRPK